MLEYLGQNESNELIQVGDRIEINGQMKEVAQVIDIGLLPTGQMERTVILRNVKEEVPLPAPVAFGLRCLAAIAGVKP